MFKYYKYDVTVSFAEEDRAFVDRVVALLDEKKIRVFYDDHERITSWGKDLGRYLDNIYRKEAKFCVIFISESYRRKRWTQYERERAQARAYFAEHKEYILPFRLDHTELEGLSDAIAYLSVETYDEHKLADAIFDKIKRNRSAWSALLQKLNGFSTKKIKVAATIAAVISVLSFSLADKLTPLEILTNRLYEQSKQRFNGAVCRDGWISHSHGSGTCSHHGGVDHYIDTATYRKSINQCREEAKEISWFN